MIWVKFRNALEKVFQIPEGMLTETGKPLHHGVFRFQRDDGRMGGMINLWPTKNSPEGFTLFLSTEDIATPFETLISSLQERTKQITQVRKRMDEAHECWNEAEKFLGFNDPVGVHRN